MDKKQLQELETELLQIYEGAAILNTKNAVEIEEKFHDTVTMPLKSVVALCEQIEKKIYESKIESITILGSC